MTDRETVAVTLRRVDAVAAIRAIVLDTSDLPASVQRLVRALDAACGGDVVADMARKGARRWVRQNKDESLDENIREFMNDYKAAGWLR